MKKKIQKDSDDFWHRKLTLKVKFWYFLTAPHYSNFQNLVISFEYSWSLANNLSNFVSLPWKLHDRECHRPHLACSIDFFLGHTQLHCNALIVTRTTEAQLSCLGRKIGQINFGTFGVFSVDLSAQILVLWVPWSCFPLINRYFYNKLSLFIYIPNIYLGSLFEFGLQRIRILVIMCP